MRGDLQRVRLGDALIEVSTGVGTEWKRYRVIGATRNGAAPAKEKVGKSPDRYKLVEPGTIFYNPMRILIGSIAMLDEGQEPGITSPDYVGNEGQKWRAASALVLLLAALYVRGAVYKIVGARCGSGEDVISSAGACGSGITKLANPGESG